MNDSSVTGYLTPTSNPPLDDASLEAVFQQMLSQMTGIDGSLVRPRWQPIVPQQPSASTNWIAVGITRVSSAGTPQMTHSGTGDGFSTLVRHELIDVLASFYGPNGQMYAEQVRDGLWLGHNNSMLQANDIGIVSASTVRSAPDFLNQQWVRRYDLEMTFRRKVTRTYSILNVESATVVLSSDSPALTETIAVSE